MYFRFMNVNDKLFNMKMKKYLNIIKSKNKIFYTQLFQHNMSKHYDKQIWNHILKKIYK